jgi:hypothetical protein
VSPSPSKERGRDIKRGASPLFGTPVRLTTFKGEVEGYKKGVLPL